ncbi:MAG: hypothetical protein M5U34_12495 [Chloroflexi bacterium]|nr:hypothetical protein [Chloroflexota bacterium]
MASAQKAHHPLSNQLITEPGYRFLAAQALVDSDEIEVYSGSIAEQTRPRVQQWQRAIVENGLLPPRDRAQAGKALATLGDDRPGVLTCDECAFAPCRAARFGWIIGRKTDVATGIPAWTNLIG